MTENVKLFLKFLKKMTYILEAFIVVFLRESNSTYETYYQPTGGLQCRQNKDQNLRENLACINRYTLLKST